MSQLELNANTMIVLYHNLTSMYLVNNCNSSNFSLVRSSTQKDFEDFNIDLNLLAFQDQVQENLFLTQYFPKVFA